MKNKLIRFLVKYLGSKHNHCQMWDMPHEACSCPYCNCSCLSASWRLRVIQFLFSRWLEVRHFDLKDGKPIPWAYERERDAW